ncbi:NAC domain-containing protein 43 [Eucalyptus grandis]|uniref:Uncharacterized protein n=2 Tax=Eucalyptus grandis TaxID=71139 RepID=A0ACC3KU27_EUCGR|nr:NAC domain-containing protein 43 [Eucalyptus grandis]KAK3429544.1 hypothetical protein EUGRSUZ_E01053 [Eucalyptus grandis]
MNLSINGQSQVPPGFRFHPTEEELLHYYLRKKVAYEKIDLDVIREVDLNKLEPWDIQEKCRIGSTPQNDWYFFSHKDKKYPTGTRTNRATAAGFWKATGRDKIIYSGFKRIGLRKTLVFYKGRAPHGQKSDWIMHEYRLDESTHDPNALSPAGDASPEEGWVVCRVFKKKNYQKTLDSPKSPSSSTSMDSKAMQQMLAATANDGVLDQILSYMGRTCKVESETPTKLNLSHNNYNHNNNIKYPVSNTDLLHGKFMHLPRLESPILPLIPVASPPFDHQDCSFKLSYHSLDEMLAETSGHQGIGRSPTPDWVAMDRLVASQLNGQVAETPKQLSSCFSDDPGSDVGGLSMDDEVQFSHTKLSNKPSGQQSLEMYGCESNDLWSFTKTSTSSSDPLRHLSV